MLNLFYANLKPLFFGGHTFKNEILTLNWFYYRSDFIDSSAFEKAHLAVFLKRANQSKHTELKSLKLMKNDFIFIFNFSRGRKEAHETISHTPLLVGLIPITEDP